MKCIYSVAEYFTTEDRETEIITCVHLFFPFFPGGRPSRVYLRKETRNSQGLPSAAGTLSQREKCPAGEGLQRNFSDWLGGDLAFWD